MKGRAMEYARTCSHCNKSVSLTNIYCSFCCSPLVKDFPRPSINVYRHTDTLIPNLVYIKGILNVTLPASEKGLLLLAGEIKKKTCLYSLAAMCKTAFQQASDMPHFVSPTYSLLRAFGKEARFICKLLEAPLYYCISLAEIERRIVLRALKEMGEDVVIRDDLLQVEDDWAHLQEARKNSALPGPIPLCPWIIAREANVLSKTISIHQTFLLNNIRPSYPGNALLSQSYLTNLEYCAAQWTEIKERMAGLANLIMLL